MSDRADRHLDAVALGLGKFLRGFDNPSVHTGSPEHFTREARKLMTIAALQVPGQSRAITYAEAAATGYGPPAPAPARAPDSPLALLLLGLTVTGPRAHGARFELPLEPLRKEVAALLRVPVLLFYLQVSDRELFFRELEAIARRDAFPLWPVTAEDGGTPLPCPACGAPMPPDRAGISVRCPACRAGIERVRSLPMVPGAAATVSYEFLRRMVALPLVTQYQEEGTIQPLQTGGPKP